VGADGVELGLPLGEKLSLHELAGVVRRGAQAERKVRVQLLELLLQSGTLSTQLCRGSQVGLPARVSDAAVPALVMRPLRLEEARDRRRAAHSGARADKIDKGL